MIIRQTIFFTFLCFKLLGQNDSLWIGDLLTEISYANNKWYYQDVDWGKEIIVENSRYYTIEELSGYKLEFPFEKLDPELDTLILKNGRTFHLFIRPALIHNSNFKFQAFEYAELDTYGQVTLSFNLNRYGHFRKANYKNETLVEKDLTDEQLNSFLELLHPIDIKNMNEASGRRNICDNKEYSFTFWDVNGGVYQYISMYQRKQLMPLSEFVTNLND